MQVQAPKTQTIKVRVEGKMGTALVDSGCTQTLVRQGWVWPKPRCGTVWIWCIHRDVKAYPVGGGLVEVARKKTGVASNIPYDVILG